MGIEIKLKFPPGPLGDAQADELLRLVIEEFGWIKPTTCSSSDDDVEPVGLGTSAEQRARMLGCYREHGLLFAEQGPHLLSLLPNRRGWLSFAGSMTLGIPSLSRALDLGRQRDEVWRVMKVVGAPVAYCADDKAIETFSVRWEPTPSGGKTSVVNVGPYDRGLEHPHWRMWLGPTYTAFFGRDVLAHAPAFSSQAMDDAWFVQVHDRASDWDQPSGIEAARKFEAALGKKTFFDPEDPDRQLEAPDFRPLMEAALRANPGWKENPGLPRKTQP